MNDRQLQHNFEFQIFTIDGVNRECYYCTLENDGAWIWLRPNHKDNCKQINFVVDSKYKLDKLLTLVQKKQDIKLIDFGSLSKQN